MSKHKKKGGYLHVNQEDRDRLQALRDAGTKQGEIAKVLKVNPSTVSREIKRNRRKYRKKKNIKNKNARYEAGMANRKARTRRRYAKYQGKKINENQDLKNYGFDAEALKEQVQKAAQALGLEVFGGDAVVNPQGQIFLIDINAWPSFALFRSEAPRQIARHLLSKISAQV